MIQFDRVSKRYAGGVEALSNISFTLEAGEMAFLTGHSGAGKSTLLKLIMLMERASGGKAVVNGIDLSSAKAKQIAFFRRQIGVVFQDHQLLPNRSVFDNVALPLQIAGYSNRDLQRRVRAALDKVGLLRLEKKTPLQLSGGEQQRVGIARAVVNRPPLLLADEPTGNLDPALSAEIMSVFEQFNDLGVSVLVATHDLALVASKRFRNFSLKSGQLIGS